MDGSHTLSPIFMLHGLLSLKCQRSSTVSSLPHIDEQYLKDAPPSVYFLNLSHKINQEQEIRVTTANKDTVVMIEMIYQIHKDYQSAIDMLVQDIETLMEKIASLNTATPRLNTPTPIPFPLPKTTTLNAVESETIFSRVPPAAPAKT